MHMLNLLTVTNIFKRLPVILFIAKGVKNTDRHLDLTESVQIMNFWIKDAMKGATVRKWNVSK